MLTYPSAKRAIYAKGFNYVNEPILLTEFGGIAYDVDHRGGWGYGSVNEQEKFITEVNKIFDVVILSPIIYGFCYTQLTDVEQEINGLLTYDRKPKCELNRIKESVLKWRPNTTYR